jgi:hypothetical protein
LASRGHEKRWPEGLRLVLAMVLAIVAVAAALIVGSVATAAPAKEPADKVNAPMNINRDKQPVLDPAQLTIPESVPLSKAEAARQAHEWVDEDPNSRIACFRGDGVLAGLAEFDRVEPGRPMTRSERARACADGFPGSQP